MHVPIPDLVCVGVIYSRKYDISSVGLRVYPQRAGGKTFLVTAGIEPTIVGMLAHALPTKLRGQVGSGIRYFNSGIL